MLYNNFCAILEVHNLYSRWALMLHFGIEIIPLKSDYHMHRCLIQISPPVKDDLKVVQI